MLHTTYICYDTLTTRGNDLRLQKNCARYDLRKLFLIIELLICGTVCQMTLCMQNLLTNLNPDWINSGLIRKLFMIIVPKFKELEVEVKFIRNCLDELYCTLWLLKRRAKRLHACARIFRLRLQIGIGIYLYQRLVGKKGHVKVILHGEIHYYRYFM